MGKVHVHVHTGDDQNNRALAEKCRVALSKLDSAHGALPSSVDPNRGAAGIVSGLNMLNRALQEAIGAARDLAAAQN